MRTHLVPLLALVLASQWPAPAVAQPPTHIVTWGGYGGGDGQFAQPLAVAVAPTGRVYVGDQPLARVQMFTGDGVYLGQWGSNGQSPGQFDLLTSVAVDANGNVLVSDNRRIQRFDPDGVFMNALGQGAEAVTIAPDGGIWVLTSQRVTRFDDSWTSLVSWFHGCTWPHGIAVDADGSVYVSDKYESTTKIRRLSSSGAFIQEWGQFGGGDGELRLPARLAVAHQNLYVADAWNSRIQVFSTGGVYLTQWGELGLGPGQFNLPMAVALGPGNTVYIADANNSRIQKFAVVPTEAPRSSWGRVKALYR